MADREPLPYPPSPADVPDDLLDRFERYGSREWLLLAGMFVFLLLYFSLILFFGFASAWLVLAIPHSSVLGVLWELPALLFTATYFFLLVKGFFFGGGADEEEMKIAITERDHPQLFAFMGRICDEIGADEPDAVHLLPDCSMGVLTHFNALSLYVRPRRDLRVGLGMVNAINLSEFKAILAHEFGHINQDNSVRACIIVVSGLIENLAFSRDWLDRLIQWLKKSGGGAAVGYPLGWALWLVRVPLAAVYRVLSQGKFDLARDREYRSDLIAAGVAGSDAIVHGFVRTLYAVETLNFAMGELRKASQHKLYSSDLYFHQHAVADILRKKKKDPKWGVPPKLDGPTAGKKIQVCDPDDEINPSGLFGDYHPSDYDREESVKERFIPAVMDERSPWLLFDDPAALRERMTRKVYKVAFNAGRNADLADPRRVQQFIDEEHAETTYAAKYEGSYDGRVINPGDLDELNDLIQRDPWPDDRLAAVFQKLYADLGDRADTRKDLMAKYDGLVGNTGPTRGRKSRRLLKDVEHDLEKMDEWFHSLDRRVYLVCVQMAYRVDHAHYFDLINRYRFHLAVQGFYKSARTHQARAHVAWNTVAGTEQLHPDDFVELMHVMRDARAALRKILRAARELDLPAMKNFEEGDRLADFLLDEDIVKELPETYVKGKWVFKLLTQLDQVMSKSARLHAKSLGGILRLQEEVAAKFLAKAEPVVAEVVPASPPPA